MKRFLALLMAAVMLTASLPPAIAASGTTEEVALQVIGAIGILSGDKSGALHLERGVTRAEFAKMLVAASALKDTVGAAGNVSPFRDVPYTHWAADYIKTAVQQGWLTGYLDGSFRPSGTVTLEEAATGCLKLLGYQTTDFSGSYPHGQLALYRSLGMDEGIAAGQGTQMTRRDMARLFYNLLGAKDKSTGKAYAETLGYSMGADGEVDYLSVVSGTLKGPFVVGDAGLAAVVSAEGKTVYRNGYVSAAEAVCKYDVVYYTAGAVWVYANAVTGTYQAAAPSTASPTSVTVAGNSYTLGTGEAALALSDLGGLNIGDVVTLLLGRNGEVVHALAATEYAAGAVGVVTATGTATYQNAVGNAYTARTVTVAATDGASYTVPCDKTAIDEGSVVSIGFGSSGTDVSVLSTATLSGKVANGAVGSRALAKDVRILDVRDTSTKCIYASRLEGAALDTGDVRYYAVNAAGEITDLILKDFTGDLYEYGILTSVSEQSSGMSLSGNYTYLLAGEKKTMNTNGSMLGASSGPARLTMENGQLTAVRALEQLKNPDAISMLGVTKEQDSYLFADDCAVYLSTNGGYSLLSLTELRGNFGSYSLTCYYDKETADGGRIRIVIARAK